MSDATHDHEAPETTSSLNHRRAWFGLFPEGSVEFLLATRILLVVLMLALAGVQEAQRSKVFLVLCAMFAVDYAVVLWWVVQAAADLCELNHPGASPDYLRFSRLGAGVRVCLPSAVFFLLVAPWEEVVFEKAVTISMVNRVARPALALLYFALLPLATGALRRVELKTGAWNLLLLVPVIHWFALHRVLANLRGKIRALSGEVPGQAAASLAIPLADATWILGLLPWVVLIIVSLLREGWFRYLVPCGALLMAVFSVADVAAIEGVQRELTALLRRPEPARRA